MDGKALIRMVMARKRIKSGAVSAALGQPSKQTFYNWLSAGGDVSLSKFAEVADILGCDVVLLDRTTKEIYR